MNRVLALQLSLSITFDISGASRIEQGERIVYHYYFISTGTSIVSFFSGMGI
jgi:hypothetical protein